MIDISTWIKSFSEVLNKTFGNRVFFVGLQGSYARNEATEASDIDVVVILDDFSVQDTQTYNRLLDSMPHRELVCGFISGKNELLNWEPSDLFQFYYDTLPISGTLDELLPLLSDAAVDRAIKIGACNIYHGCVHNMLHEKSDEILTMLYKSAVFVIQAICFKATKTYIYHKNDLLSAVSSDERTIVEISLDLKNGKPLIFDKMSELIFNWSKKWINVAK